MDKTTIWLPAIKAGSGADAYTERLRDALVSIGYDVHITWFEHYTELAPFVFRKKPPKNTKLIIANTWSGFAFYNKNVPLLVVEHHNIFDSNYIQYKSHTQKLYHDLLLKFYIRKTYKKASHIVCVSNYTANSISGITGSTPVTTIYNWIDTKLFKPNDAVNHEKDVFNLLFVGNTSYRKGADLLPKIMSELGSNYHLKHTGGVISSELNNMSALGKLTNDELVKQYQNCDALLFPSRFEGFGYAPLEAMSCGKPAITTKCSSLSEVVIDNVTGFLCERDNVSSYVNACRKLSEKSDLYKEMSLAARKRAVENFSEKRSIQKYSELIEALINKEAAH